MKVNFRDVSSMDHNERIAEYRHDCKDEAILDMLNDGVGALEYHLYGSIQRVPASSILITGAPRSGTTFLYQLMASSLHLGYVSNLMARFYAAPLTGAWLQTRLIHSEISELANFSSIHGVTKRVYEPHEFGYFWAKHFPFQGDNHEDVDKSELCERIKSLETTLQSISGIFQKPVVYKCMIAPFILNELLAHTSVFVVHIVRDKKEVIDSILEVRRKRLASIERWWSIRPAGWMDAMKNSPQEQVKWQYERVVNAIKKCLPQYPDQHIEVEYDQLVKAPKEVLSLVAEKYQLFSGNSI